MMASEWVHCNKCTIRSQGRPNLKFYLVDCGHLLCQQCVRHMNDKCLMCERGTKTVLISSEMSDNIKAFFMPLDESCDKLKQTIKFQTNNYANLLKKILHKYTFCKDELFKERRKNKDLQEELLKVQLQLKEVSAENSKLNQQNLQSNMYATSTPQQQCISDPFFPADSSLVSSIKRTPTPGNAIRVNATRSSSGCSSHSRSQRSFRPPSSVGSAEKSLSVRMAQLPFHKGSLRQQHNATGSVSSSDTPTHRSPYFSSRNKSQERLHKTSKRATPGNSTMMSILSKVNCSRK